MSVHLKQGQKPLGKVGKPGSFLLEEIDDTTITNVILEKIISEILDSAESSESTNIEISKKNALVIQYRDYRITITRPPFSDAIEITIVHPIIKLSLDDYGISEKLMNRLTEKAEGILISGPPGSGKSTLASGLANYITVKIKLLKRKVVVIKCWEQEKGYLDLEDQDASLGLHTAKQPTPLQPSVYVTDHKNLLRVVHAWMVEIVVKICKLKKLKQLF